MEVLQDVADHMKSNIGETSSLLSNIEDQIENHGTINIIQPLIDVSLPAFSKDRESITWGMPEKYESKTCGLAH